MEKKRLIIAFGGEAEHGKSTCASLTEEYLKSRSTLPIQILAFAERLKQACMILFRLTPKDVYTTRGKAAVQPHLGENATARKILQKVGSEVCRDFLPRVLPEVKPLREQSIWVWNIDQDIQEHSESHIIVQDLRFPDEEKMLRTHGAVIVKVVRPGYGNCIYQHQSETAQASIRSDYVIVNDQGIEELKRKVYELLEKLA